MTSAPPEGFEPIDEPPGFDAMVGPYYRKEADDGPVHGFLAEARHINPRGVIHGGMLMTFIDRTLGSLVWHAIDGRPCATVSLNTDFLAPGRPGDWIECRGQVTRQTRALVFVRGELTAGDRTLMTASGVWKKLGAS